MLRFAYRFWKLALPMVLLACAPLFSAAQTTYVPARITQAIDNSQLTTLKGNTHPLARPEFDRGPAPPNLPMNRMLLVLQRSPNQETALETLLNEQQDKSSLNYHKWLTPVEFGREFGPSDQDIQTVVAWLNSQGFQGIHVSNGRTVIEFSGTASLVQQAFHTAIHKYEVNGEEHWANASDPQIPTALTPVVAGVATLHNFYKQPQSFESTQRLKFKKAAGPLPQVTFPGNPQVHALGPTDYATIYNIAPLYTANINGAGTIIAIVGRSNINLDDVVTFRSIFNVAGPTPQVIVNGTNPGDLGGGEEAEAVLDTTWSGALAPGANVDLVVSASTNTTDGVDLSEVYIIDNNLGDVMSESFGSCEQGATQADETAIASLAEQAAAQGITYMVASGDSGAEGCSNPNTQTIATGPVSVNILASSPYTVAVGGTEFVEGTTTTSYWSTATNGIAPTALSYIPENVWNESCVSGCGQKSAGAIWAGGGGASILAKKPIWQASVAGIPTDNARDLPDVSLTAAGHDAYLMCIDGICQNGEIALISGTSAAAPSFAGIMALVRQKTGERQGQADFVLYRLAAQETLANCNASSQTALPKSSCIFNDVTLGNNAVPGEVNYGKSTAQYQATTGYDLAAGLGSVNAANLVDEWNTARSVASSVTLNVNPATGLVHGNPVNFTIGVTAAPPATGTPTGDVALIADFGEFLTSQTSGGDFTLSAGGSVSSSTKLLPGGTYNLTAHYEGDGTFIPGDSAPLSITVAPENTTTTLAVLNGGSTGPPFTSGTYGTPISFISTVGWQSGVGAPTASVIFYDNLGSPIPTATVGGNGSAATLSFALISPGSHSVTASYIGDPSFLSSNSSPVAFTISQASTTTSIQPPQSVIVSGTPSELDLLIQGTGQGAIPSGTFTLSSGTTQIASGFIQNYGPIPPTSLGIAHISQLPPGQSTLTAKYSGDANYTASTSAPLTVNVVRNSSTSLSSSNQQVQVGTSVTFTATVTTTPTGGPAMTGAIQFEDGSSNLGAPVVIASGQAQLTTSSLAAGVHNIVASYSGDSNYAPSSNSVTETIELPPSFTIVPTTNPISVSSPGAAGSTVLTFSTQNGFNGTINLSPSDCSGLPSETTCSFSTSSVTLNSGANPPVMSATATLTIQTTAPSAVGPGVFRNPGTPLVGRWAAALALLLFAMIAFQVSRRRWSAALTTLAFAALLTFSACGGGGGGPAPPTNPGTPPGIYSNVVINIPGAAQPLTVTVTVNP